MDPGTISLLASLLAAALPALQRGGEVAAEAALEKVGESLGEGALGKLKALFKRAHRDPEAKKALAKAAEQPAVDAQAALTALFERLLDRHDELERSLVEALRALALGGVTPRSEDDEPRIDYLYHLLAQVSYLRLPVPGSVRGGTSAARLPLGEVYVSLQAQAQEPPPRPATELLTRHKRLVLIGESGAGKSTFVDFVAACLAGEQLQDERFNLKFLVPLVSEEQRRSLATLPMRISLRDYGSQMGPTSAGVAKDLLAYLECKLDAAGLNAYAQRLDNELRRGALLLLDGLDEVPELDDRREKVCKSLLDVAVRYRFCRLLVTSRGHAYPSLRPLLEDGFFVEARLQPLSIEAIRDFVERWHRSLSLSAKTSPALSGDHLLREIEHDKRLRALAERPLFLALLTHQHLAGGGSLMGRDRLFEEVLTRSLPPRAVQLNAELRSASSVLPHELRDVLEEIAYEAHASQPEPDGAADIPEKKLVGALIPLCRRTRTNPLDLVDYLHERAGLLVRRDEFTFGLFHQAFQEYLAACHLLGTRSSSAIVALAKADSRRWREVVVLAGAKAARAADARLWDLIDALCRRRPHNNLAAARAVQIAVQILAEFVDLRAVATEHQHKLDQLRDWLVSMLRSDRLGAIERAQAGSSLARLGDSRFRAEKWFLPKDPTAGFLAIPPWGSDPAREARADYFVARYPVTVKQFDEFVRSTKHPADHRCLDAPPNQPVAYVSWHDAEAYCRWLARNLRDAAAGESSRRALGTAERCFWQGIAAGELRPRLPLEQEWEKAAGGIDGLSFPWGDEPDPRRSNYRATAIGGRTAVGCFYVGRSLFSGCEDMSGNIWEWTRDLGAPGERYVRGGSFQAEEWDTRCVARVPLPDGERREDVGFRLVISRD